MKTVTFPAMGINVQITIRATQTDSNDEMNKTIEQAKDGIADLKSRLSRFQNDSEISQTNHKPGQFVDIHEDTLKYYSWSSKPFCKLTEFIIPALVM